MPLSEAVRTAREMQAGALVVVDNEGRPVGLVSENAVEATPEHRRPWVDVADLSQRLEPGLLVSTGLVGEELLQALRGRPSTEYLVVEPDGRTFGVLARRDVDAAFARAVNTAR
jgi:CBS-domain-containing membrane protein